MKLLQRRSYKHLDLFKSLIISYYMGGVEQARKSAKKLKVQVNERDCSRLLLGLSNTATDEEIETIMNNIIKGFKHQGAI